MTTTERTPALGDEADHGRRIQCNDGGLTVIDAAEWTPCSPDWLAAHPGQCGVAPRVWNEAGPNHCHPVNWPDHAPKLLEGEAVAWRWRWNDEPDVWYHGPDLPSAGPYINEIVESQPLYAHPAHIGAGLREKVARIIDPLVFDLTDALNNAEGEPEQLRNDATARLLPLYTVTLVKYRTNAGTFKPHAVANLMCPYGEITEYVGNAPTPALALAAAILKARTAAEAGAVGEAGE